MRSIIFNFDNPKEVGVKFFKKNKRKPPFKRTFKDDHFVHRKFFKKVVFNFNLDFEGFLMYDTS